MQAQGERPVAYRILRDAARDVPHVPLRIRVHRIAEGQEDAVHARLDLVGFEAPVAELPGERDEPPVPLAIVRDDLAFRERFGRDPSSGRNSFGRLLRELRQQPRRRRREVRDWRALGPHDLEAVTGQYVYAGEEPRPASDALDRCVDEMDAAATCRAAEGVAVIGRRVAPRGQSVRLPFVPVEIDHEAVGRSPPAPDVLRGPVPEGVCVCCCVVETVTRERPFRAGCCYREEPPSTVGHAEHGVGRETRGTALRRGHPGRTCRYRCAICFARGCGFIHCTSLIIVGRPSPRNAPASRND